MSFFVTVRDASVFYDPPQTTFQLNAYLLAVETDFDVPFSKAEAVVNLSPYRQYNIAVT